MTRRHTEAPAAGRVPQPVQQPVQDTLPLEVADGPVPYTLTARARRAVAPRSVPDLSLVEDSRAGTADPPGGLDDPRDMRAAQARALRRAGLSVAAIADRLGADASAVREWVGDAVAADGVAATRSSRLRGAAPPGPAGDPSGTAVTERDAGVARARAVARAAVASRLTGDDAFAAGLGLVAGIARTSGHAVIVTTADREVARAAVRWLRAALDVAPARLRVVLRVGPRVAGDVARHRWADALGVTTDRVSHARWREAPHPQAVEAIVRIADPRVAATLAGWRDALLASVPGRAPADARGA